MNEGGERKRWSLATLVAVALLSAVLVACGGDDGTGSDSVARDGGESASTTTAATKDEPPGQGYKTKTTTTGKGAHGAEVFFSENGTNDVQKFGVEASAAERQAAAEAVGGYIEGGAEERWAQQCQYLSKTIIEPLEKAVAAEGRGDESCAEILDAIGKRSPAYRRADNMARAVGSLRVEGNRGYAIYWGTDGFEYGIPVSREGGQWKVAAAEPLLLP